eukprot:2152530-Rhodomonas_salina.1
MRPRGLSGGLRDLQTGSESIRRAFSSLKMIPRDRLEAGSESIRRVPVRSSPEVQQSDTKRPLFSRNVGKIAQRAAGD